MNGHINSHEMKKNNRELVLKCIRGGKYSRADIAIKTKMTRASVTNIVNELIENNMVKEGAVLSDGKVGRSSTILSIDSSKGYVIGINISRIGVSTSVCDYDCNLLRESFIEFDVGKQRVRTLEYIERQLNGYFETFGKEKFLGIGISVPGPVNAKKGQILKPTGFSDWWDFNFKNYFYGAYGLNVTVANNATTFTVYEHVYGKAKDYSDFIGIVIDSGVGGCAIIDGEVYYGVSGIGLEIGHVCLDMNGERCLCGSTGCSELYIATQNILKYAMSEDPAFTAWNIIVDAAENGNPKACAVIQKQAKYLANLLISVTNSWDMQCFYIFGDMCYKPEILHGYIKKMFNKSFLWHNENEISIFFADSVNTTSSVAAANLALLETESL